MRWTVSYASRRVGLLTAGSDEPRAAVAATGKQEEDPQIFSQICGWFTEGFGTKDLQEAKALVDKLT